MNTTNDMLVDMVSWLSWLIAACLFNVLEAVSSIPSRAKILSTLTN